MRDPSAPAPVAVARIPVDADPRRRRLTWAAIAIGFASALVVAVLVLERATSGGGRGDTLASDASGFWTTLDPRHVRGRAVAGPDGESAIALELEPGRRYFTVVQHAFRPPVDWSRRPYVLIDLRTRLGAGVSLFIDFAGGGRRFAKYDITDGGTGWRRVALSTGAPSAVKGRPEWRNVVRLRVVTSSKLRRGELGLGRVELANPVDLR